jgi:hypothetical protein
MATDVFRFLDLHPQIRDRIYHIILCTWPAPKSTYDEKRQLAVVPNELAYIHHKIDTGILLANHRISRDAMDVLVKGNLFVRLVFRGVDVYSLMAPKQVPIVAEGEWVVKAFKGHVMTHSIEMPQPFSARYMMILRRDHDLFCQALVGGGITNFGRDSKHCVTIHNPFIGTPTPHYLDLKKQASYLFHIRESPFFHGNPNNHQPKQSCFVANNTKPEYEN